MTTLKAIETTYRGCRFRSRTEARWAVFFDALKIEWQYEREGFELPSGRYLPDFWLPKVGIGCWFEVKGQEPTTREISLARELAHASNYPVFIFGNCQMRAEVEVYASGTKFEEWLLQQPHGLGFFPLNTQHYDKQRFLICADCGMIGITTSECYLPCQGGTSVCKHCKRSYRSHHFRIDGDVECGEGFDTDYEADLNRFQLPAREFLVSLGDRRTEWQETVLHRSCDCGGLQNREQMLRLKRAFDSAAAARFEFGASG